MLKCRLVKFCLVFASALIIVACGKSPEQKIVVKSCVVAKCHDMKPLEKKKGKLGEQDWKNVVAAMKVRGAIMTTEEQSIIAKYVYDTYGAK